MKHRSQGWVRVLPSSPILAWSPCPAVRVHKWSATACESGWSSSLAHISGAPCGLEPPGGFA
eukprot:1118633-Prorocentrum_lima.AAC.1